ncbi:MAG: YggT family protein [Rhodocyclaceae bacterium]|nr:YggT family protein [Rhodocyclaceae bacterium]
MLTNILMLLVSAAASFLTVLLLARFFMQWQRLPFRNQMGQFIAVTTNWIVLPLRKLIPGLGGLDLASLVAAWLVQALAVGIEYALRGAGLGGGLLALMFGLGLFEVLRMMVYLLIGVVLISAVLSWVNPHAPIAPTIFGLADPFLRPFRRIVPPIAGIDLSPLVLLLVLQVVLMVIGSLQAAILPLVLG